MKLTKATQIICALAALTAPHTQAHGEYDEPIKKLTGLLASTEHKNNLLNLEKQQKITTGLQQTCMDLQKKMYEEKKSYQLPQQTFQENPIDPAYKTQVKEQLYKKNRFSALGLTFSPLITIAIIPVLLTKIASQLPGLSRLLNHQKLVSLVNTTWPLTTVIVQNTYHYSALLTLLSGAATVYFANRVETSILKPYQALEKEHETREALLSKLINGTKIEEEEDIDISKEENNE